MEKLVGNTTSEIAQCKTPLNNSSFPSFGAIPLNMPSPPFSNSIMVDTHFFAPFDQINYGNNFLEAPLENKQEMTDKTTQTKMSCEKCASLWSILDKRKRKGLNNEGHLLKR